MKLGAFNARLLCRTRFDGKLICDSHAIAPASFTQQDRCVDDKVKFLFAVA